MAAFDLHIHSEYSSDGEFSVAELVGKCLGAQLTLFSLTDHNSVRGVGEAARLACERGIGFVPGIEIDCNYRGTDLHLLGVRHRLAVGGFRTARRGGRCQGHGVVRRHGR